MAKFRTSFFVSGASFLQNDSISFEAISNFAPSQLKCNVVAGVTPFVKTNNTALAVTAINTGVTPPFGPGGPGFTPAVGDAILRITTTTGGDVNWAFSTFYHSDPSVIV